MKVLVTGATGFIGNHLIRHLLENDAEVIATSRSAEKAKQFQWYPKVKYIPWDLGKEQVNFFSFFEEPQCIIHLAWDGLSDYKSLIHFEKNVPVHYNFIKNMVHHGLKHVVITGTCLEYGIQSGELNEDLETRPSTPYGLAKDTLRKYLEQLFTLYSVKFQWIRLFYVYGDGQSDTSLLSQLKKAVQSGEKKFKMSGGEQLRDYLAVQKVAELIFSIAKQDKVRGVVNCSSGQPISVRKFVETFINKKGYSIELDLGYYPYPDYEPLAFWGDNRKLLSILRQK